MTEPAKRITLTIRQIAQASGILDLTKKHITLGTT